MFHQKAAELGIAFERRAWSPEEDQILRDLAGVKGIRAIARALKRSVESTQSRLHRLDLSQRVREGYNISDLRTVLGASEGTVRAWMRRGLLGTVKECVGLRVKEAAVVRFLCRHSSEYDLRRVDQGWYKSMIFGQGAERSE